MLNLGTRWSESCLQAEMKAYICTFHRLKVGQLVPCAALATNSGAAASFHTCPVPKLCVSSVDWVRVQNGAGQV
jgi:hypothetical protein